MQYVGSSEIRRIALDSYLVSVVLLTRSAQVMFTLKQQNFPGAAIFPRKYGRSVKLGLHLASILAQLDLGLVLQNDVIIEFSA